VAGTLLEAVGGTAWDPADDRGLLLPSGEGFVFGLLQRIPPGVYEFKVASEKPWTEAAVCLKKQKERALIGFRHGGRVLFFDDQNATEARGFPPLTSPARRFPHLHQVALNGNWDVSYGIDGASHPGCTNMQVEVHETAHIGITFDTTTHCTLIGH
jgi:hypothetical protein